MPLSFSDAELEHLRNETGIPLPKLKANLTTKEALSNFNVNQLKTVITFVSKKVNAHITKSGRKDRLIKNLEDALFSPGYEASSPTACKVPTVTVSSAIEHRTFEHNVNVKAPTAVPMPSPSSSICTSTKRITFEDANFVDRQSPFFEQVDQPLVFHFAKHDGTYCRNSFVVDASVLSDLKNRPNNKFAVHVRFFATSKGADIPWNIDVKVLINGNVVDLSRYARKIRSKPLKDPYILPRPLDITPYVRASNMIEFLHPGESGICVVQVVRNKSMEEMVSHVVSSQTTQNGYMQTNCGDGDLEEVNYMLSLRCPLGLHRIQTPVKGRSCTHAQCFDLKTYLEFSHQQQLWQCPVCTYRSPYKDLVVDPKFQQILSSVSSEHHQVIMHRDGTFEVYDSIDQSKARHNEKSKSPVPLEQTNGNSNNNNNNNSIIGQSFESAIANVLRQFSSPVSTSTPSPITPSQPGSTGLSNGNVNNKTQVTEAIVISDDED
jgi:hypothetical protein